MMSLQPQDARAHHRRAGYTHREALLVLNLLLQRCLHVPLLLQLAFLCRIIYCAVAKLLHKAKLVGCVFAAMSMYQSVSACSCHTSIRAAPVPLLDWCPRWQLADCWAPQL